MKQKKTLEKISAGIPLIGSHKLPRTRKRWRVEIINENTLSSIFRIRLTGVKARLAAICALASIISLVVVIFTFTPLGKWIWGERDLRSRYVELSLKLDSLSVVAAAQDAYTANIRAILSDSIAFDSVVPAHVPVSNDTLMSASEAERKFVEKFESNQRYNLSVLSPIAAEGMIFESPVLTVGSPGAVSSVYRGTVIGVYTGTDGRSSIIVQHPNDFISIYGNLSGVYVGEGTKVAPGQRLGSSDIVPSFELWRGGTKLDESLYIPFPIPETID